MKNNKTVVLGMSGGVDSSVAAIILKDQGYNVIGLYMNNWEDEESDICPGALDWEDVVAVSGQIGIAHYSIKFNKEYMRDVFDYFLSELKQGLTPNPDVLCNRKIKFGVFRDYAKKLGADYIATGHYSRLRRDYSVEFIDNFDNDILLMRAKDNNKDQSYFLNQVTSEQLNNVLFPLQDIDKTTVRQIASKYNLVNSHKKDSTGICFIGERKLKQFLARYLPTKRGNIVDIKDNKIVGEHSGLMNYTIGQRRGLGIGGIKDDYCDKTLKQSNRWFVVKKDLKTNTLMVSRQEQADLLSSGCIIEYPNIIGGKLNTDKFECTAKLRYRQEDIMTGVEVLDKTRAVLTFTNKQRAVTMGQYAVLYSGERCLGGAKIIGII